MFRTSEPEIVHVFANFSGSFDHPIHGTKIEKWKLATAPAISSGQFRHIYQGVKVHLHEWKDLRISHASVDRALSYKPPTWAGIIGNVGVITRRDRHWVEFSLTPSASADSETIGRINLLVPLEWVRLGFFGWVHHIYLCICHGGHDTVPFTFTLTPPAIAALKASRNREVQLLPAPVVFRRFSDLEASGQDLYGAQTETEQRIQALL